MILTEDKQFASESGHWYRRSDGAPMYQVPRADGKGMRNTTLRDARKLDLVPSVSMINRCMASPGLERYKLRQLGLALLTLPRLPDESEDAFLARAEQDAAEHSKQAAAVGEQIHGAIESHIRGSYLGTQWTPWIIEAIGELDKHCGLQHWEPEKSFSDPVLSYGGKRDLLAEDLSWLIDMKTKDGPLEGSNITIYDEHQMQLAAYSHPLLPRPRCGILFVRRDKPEAKLVEVAPDRITQGWLMFEALLAFWKAKNGVHP